MLLRIKHHILFAFLLSTTYYLLPTVARAQLGALGGVSGIEEGGKIVGPLFTLAGEVGAANAGTMGLYFFYTQVTRSFGKPLDQVYSGNPEQRVTYAMAFFSYNPLDVLQLTAIIPYVETDFQQTVVIDPATNTTQRIKSSSGGLSNPLVRGKYQFLKHPYTSFAVSLFPPSGYEGIGSQALDIRTSLAVTEKFPPGRFDGEIAYQFAGVWTRGPASNDTVSGNAALSLDAGERLSAFLEVNYVYNGFYSVDEPSSTGGTIHRESQQHRLDITPGMRVKVKDRVFATLATKIGVYNTFYRGYYYFYSMGLDYAF